eukprot:TRINITY_DN1503_c0_g1_i2.p1 TRINITY_DN1503_c0_g1~~TRINITY_DN1503_c0_g1_i2.p1  ORF type:complete len:460 (-),score=201.54 TRINITY_DN1503_c0_g1_i2:332-1648(-)
MSGRFVRQSKFRHVHPKVEKKENSYLDVRSNAAADGNLIKANTLFFALPTTGGGGPVFVHRLDAKGKFGANEPTLNVHRGNVVDVDWNPFNEHILATASEDCTAKVSIIPEGGLQGTLDEAVVTLNGHDKKLSLVHFHPTANNVLATASADLTIRVWDIERQSEMTSFTDHPDLIQSFEWNAVGSQIATTCKDKNIRIYDPRAPDAIGRIPGFQGGKQSRVFWIDNHGLLGAVGFDRSSLRQMGFWDPRNMGDPLHVVDIDQSAGALMPFYDPDTSILYLAGKGDGNLRYYELVNERPYCHYIDEHRSNDPQKGAAVLPKRACDTSVVEISRFLRLLTNWIEVVSFQVPRKTDNFQRDIYPDTYAGVPSMTCAEWWAGANTPAPLRSMNPAQAPAAAASPAAAFQVGRSEVEELRKLCSEQASRIKELEEELAKLRAA